jgi:hypothetical protein
MEAQTCEVESSLATLNLGFQKELIFTKLFILFVTHSGGAV